MPFVAIVQRAPLRDLLFDLQETVCAKNFIGTHSTRYTLRTSIVQVNARVDGRYRMSGAWSQYAPSTIKYACEKSCCTIDGRSSNVFLPLSSRTLYICAPATSRVRLGRAARLLSVLAVLARDHAELRHGAPQRLLRARNRRRHVEVHLKAQQLLRLRAARHQNDRVLALQQMWTLVRVQSNKAGDDIFSATGLPTRAVALQRMQQDSW